MLGAIQQLSAPAWAEWAGGVNSALAAAALIIGGLFAYIRFVRGRVLHAQCELEIVAGRIDVADLPALRVTATVTNAGSFRLLFPPSTSQTVTVTGADRPMWDFAVDSGQMLWSEGIPHQQELLVWEGAKEADVILEPSERLRRCLLFPMGDGPWLAYHVGMRVEACPKMIWRTRPPLTWETELVLSCEGT